MTACNTPCTAAKTTSSSSLLLRPVASPAQSLASRSPASAKSLAGATSNSKRPTATPTPSPQAAGNTSPDRPLTKDSGAPFYRLLLAVGRGLPHIRRVPRFAPLLLGAGCPCLPSV